MAVAIWEWCGSFVVFVVFASVRESAHNGNNSHCNQARTDVKLLSEYVRDGGSGSGCLMKHVDKNDIGNTMVLHGTNW